MNVCLLFDDIPYSSHLRIKISQNPQFLAPFLTFTKICSLALNPDEQFFFHAKTQHHLSIAPSFENITCDLSFFFF